MKIKKLLLAALVLFAFNCPAQTVTDIDGNVYNTVSIGTQVWMKENLKVKHYRNGNAIPNVTDNSSWGNLTTGARSFYDNDSLNSVPVYGGLYNWYAVNDPRKICPLNWHVPSEPEWNVLSKFLDNTVDTNASGWVGTHIGGDIKEAGYSHWNSPNAGASNSSGFSAMPAGTRYPDGSFLNIGTHADLWSSTPFDDNNIWRRNLGWDKATFNRNYYVKTYGFSVRCICDFASNIENNNFQKEFKIFPNPASDRININYTVTENVKMQIYNIVGAVVIQSELIGGSNEIDISSLSKGIYIIRLTNNTTTVQQKLIKE
ncbi:MAG: FISUMP domain-containing protein [Bacteroidota bacterium]